MRENRLIRYAIVIQRAGDAYAASVPDLPGCAARAPTITAVRRAITNAIRVHIRGLIAVGEPIPEPTTTPAGQQPVAEADDPFMAFTEWAGEADEAAYAEL